MNDIKFIDTTLRDGNQSLWGNRMPTGMALSLASQIDQLGFEAMEGFGGGSRFRIRLTGEDPLEVARRFQEKKLKTPLSFIGGAGSDALSTQSRGMPPLAYVLLRTERSAAQGMKRFNVVANLNDMNFRMPEIVRHAQGCGLKVVIAIQFSLTPKHTDDYYAEKTRDAVKLKPEGIYLKDAGGLLTPERIRTLVPIIQQNSGGLPLELHSHCTTGLAPLCYLEAIKLGIRTLHTSIPPLANGSGQPSILNVAKNARLLGYTPQFDEDAIKPVSDYITFFAKKEGLPLGAPLEYDYSQYVHQVPGGVISNLRRQLTEIRMESRLDEVLEESKQVFKDLGYPIMITPFSQFVVTQATMNVMLGERYREVFDEIIQYALGRFGEDARSGMDPDVKAKILDRRQAKEMEMEEPWEPSIDEFRKKIGGPGVSDDEILLRYQLGGEEQVRAMRKAPAPIKEYLSARTPFIVLLEDLLKRTDLHHIRLEKPGLSLTLKK